ncbi:hypothetical protein ACFLTD_04075 [Elusimicrobiota bacterium]
MKKRILVVSVLIAAAVFSSSCFAAVNENMETCPNMVLDKNGNQMRKISAITDINGKPIVVKYQYDHNTVSSDSGKYVEMLSGYAKIMIRLLDISNIK